MFEFIDFSSLLSNDPEIRREQHKSFVLASVMMLGMGLLVRQIENNLHHDSAACEIHGRRIEENCVIFDGSLDVRNVDHKYLLIAE